MEDNIFNLLGIKFSVDLDSIINLNYDPILEDINKSLSVWKKDTFLFYSILNFYSA